MLSWILKRLLGYSVITVEGLYMERLINLLLSEGVRVTRVKRLSHTSLRLTVSARYEKHVVEILQANGYLYRILGRGGSVKVLKHLKKRLALVISAAVAVVLLVLFSNHVWVVKIEGAEKLEQTRIEQMLAESGLTAGVSKGSLDKKAIENKLLLTFPELSWVGIEIKGIKATVRLAEMDEPPVMQDKDTPSDIVAACDGTVTKVTVLQGEALVKEGDVVKKGQLLIRGEEKDGQKRAALGEVLAEVWHRSSGASLLYETVAVRTGESVANRYFVVGGRELTDEKLDVPYLHYEYIRNEQTVGGELFFGLTWVDEQAHEIEYITNQISVEDAKASALATAQSKLNEVLGEHEALYSNIVYQNIDNKLVTAEMFVCVSEDIALQVTE